MTEITQNIPFCTERLKYMSLSTFGEPSLQEIPGDYTQASKISKTTGINDREH